MAIKYQPESPASYKKEQIIFSSGRILFNAREDSILLFANKSIGLSSSGTLNFDCEEEFIVNAKRIDLGLNAVEPLLKGNQTTNLIKRLIEQINTLCNALSTLVGVPAGIPILPVNLAAQTVIGNLSTMLSQLESLKSKQNYTV